LGRDAGRGGVQDRPRTAFASRPRARGPRARLVPRQTDGLSGLQTMRDVGQRPLELPQQTHDTAERLGHGRALAAQGIELALEAAVDPAKLAQLSTEPLAFLLSLLERAPQSIALVDQRRDHVAELILAFR